MSVMRTSSSSSVSTVLSGAFKAVEKSISHVPPVVVATPVAVTCPPCVSTVAESHSTNVPAVVRSTETCSGVDPSRSVTAAAREMDSPTATSLAAVCWSVPVEATDVASSVIAVLGVISIVAEYAAVISCVAAEADCVDDAAATVKFAATVPETAVLATTMSKRTSSVPSVAYSSVPVMCSSSPAAALPATMVKCVASDSVVLPATVRPCPLDSATWISISKTPPLPPAHVVKSRATWNSSPASNGDDSTGVTLVTGTHRVVRWFSIDAVLPDRLAAPVNVTAGV